MAADWQVVGEASRAEVAVFFAEQIEWLVERLTGVDPHEGAVLALSALEGSMLLSRAGATVDPTRLVSLQIATLVRNR